MHPLIGPPAAGPAHHPARPPNRRLLLQCIAAAATGTSLPWQAAHAAETYPARPIRVVVPFGPGGLADISMRLAGQKLSERLGQPVVVDNRPGAGGVAAANVALTAPRDGYTLIMFSNGTTIAKTLYKQARDYDTDFVPISTLAYFDLILLVGKDSPVQDLAALLAEGRKRRLTIGTINPGSTQNLSAELFRSVAKVQADIIPYKSTPEVLTALIRGDVDVAFESYAALKSAVDSGQARVIAATGRERSPWLPKVPTVREAGLPGYEVAGWNALYAARGTPQAAIDLLQQQMQQVMALPDLRQRLIGLGTDPRASTPAEMAAIFRRDTESWARVIHTAGIQPQ